MSNAFAVILVSQRHRHVRESGHPSFIDRCIDRATSAFSTPADSGERSTSEIRAGPGVTPISTDSSNAPFANLGARCKR
jgi:hypothetical protein